MLDIIEKLESDVRNNARSCTIAFDYATNATQMDRAGVRYIDFSAGAGTHSYGHNNPRVKEALLDYIQRDGIQHGQDTVTCAKIKFLKTLEEVILRPRGMDYKAQFTGLTRTHCVEAAIQLARKLKGRSHIIAFTNAHHEDSLSSLALAGQSEQHHVLENFRNDITHLPFAGYSNDFGTINQLDQMLSDQDSGLAKPAAIILETIHCDSGIKVASSAWLQRVAQICERHDVLLIVDDDQAGYGRTGQFFSFEESEIEPDLVCLSKSIGGGQPLALVLLRRELDVWEAGEHTGPGGASTLAFVAGEAILSYWATNTLRQEVEQKGATINAALASIASEYSDEQPFTIRGRGMFWGIDVKDRAVASNIVEECLKRKLIVEAVGSRGQVIQVTPPLTVEDSILHAGLDVLRAAFRGLFYERPFLSTAEGKGNAEPEPNGDTPPTGITFPTKDDSGTFLFPTEV